MSEDQKMGYCLNHEEKYKDKEITIEDMKYVLEKIEEKAKLPPEIRFINMLKAAIDACQERFHNEK